MARIIPRRTMDDIRFGNDIVDVIGSYITLKRAGSAFKALCPFHKEKTPSFHVNPQRQIYHCFGCGAGGDVFSFVVQHEGVDFMTAARMLAQRAGVALEMEEGEAEEASLKETLYRIHQGVAEFYQRCLIQVEAAQGAREYLEERELDKDTVQAFSIGYAPNRWDAVLKWAEKHKISRDHMEQAGLILRSTRENARSEFYDRFRNRLMFPIRDEQERVIGFSGRALEEGAKTAKYLNSPETPLFKKSRVLYALDKARRSIAETREALVCEGQIDVIRCHKAGVTTAVAAQGTAFTDNHAHILKRYADSVCLVFDPDKAGQDAAVRAATVFMDAGLAVRVGALPEGQDPDTFIRKNGIEAFKSIQAKAESAVAFQIRVLSARENMKSEVGMMRVSRAVLETIQHSPNAVQRAKLIQQASERLNLPASALMDDLRFMMRRSRPPVGDMMANRDAASGAAASARTPEDADRPKEEIELCEHMVRLVDHPNLVPLIRKYAPPKLLIDAGCRRVAETILQGLDSGEDLLTVLRTADASEEVLRFAAQLQMAPTKSRGKEFSPEDAVKGLILRIWRRRFEQERTRLSGPGKEDEQAARDERRAQLTYQINGLKTWENGVDVIDFEMEHAREEDES